jgi:hypothetical protein
MIFSSPQCSEFNLATRNGFKSSRCETDLKPAFTGRCVAARINRPTGPDDSAAALTANCAWRDHHDHLAFQLGKLFDQIKSASSSEYGEQSQTEFLVGDFPTETAKLVHLFTHPQKRLMLRNLIFVVAIVSAGRNLIS